MASKGKISFKRAVLDDETADKLIRMGGGAGVVGLAAAFGLGASAGDHMNLFMHSYLIAYCFFLSIALGALFFVTLQHLTKAGWSVLVRRIAEGLSMAVVPMGILFLPILGLTLSGNHSLYEWTDPAVVAADHIIHHKAPYLNTPFFTGRMIFYFILWGLAARFFMKTSMAQDDNGDEDLTTKMEQVSAPMMVFFTITMTLCAIDVIMSLQPHYFSTIFGVYYFGGSMVAFFASISLICLWLGEKGMLPGVNVEHYHDLGKFLFASNFFWGYVAFAQFMLTWYAHIPEETEWYVARQREGWLAVGALLVVVHFAIPFVGLISRHAKRNLKIYRFWCVWLLVCHWIDMLYLIGPAAGGHGHPAHVNIGPVDLVSLIGIGGIFVASFGFFLKGKRLVPIRDPRLRESLSLHNM